METQNNQREVIISRKRFLKFLSLSVSTAAAAFLNEAFSPEPAEAKRKAPKYILCSLNGEPKPYIGIKVKGGPCRPDGRG